MEPLTRAVVDGAVGMACVASLTYMLRHLVMRSLPRIHQEGLRALGQAREDFGRFLNEQRVAEAERLGRVEARWERAAQAAYANHAQVAESLLRVERSLAALSERLDRENGHGHGE